MGEDYRVIDNIKVDDSNSGLLIWKFPAVTAKFLKISIIESFGGERVQINAIHARYFGNTIISANSKHGFCGGKRRIFRRISDF